MALSLKPWVIQIRGIKLNIALAQSLFDVFVLIAIVEVKLEDGFQGSLCDRGSWQAELSTSARYVAIALSTKPKT